MVLAALMILGSVDVFLHSSLLLVVVIKVAILAFSFGVDKAVGVRASVCVTVSTVLMVAVVTHSLSVVLLVLVRALDHFHSLSFQRDSV